MSATSGPVRRPVVDLEGRSYATVDEWMAEVERRATEKYGPRETRYQHRGHVTVHKDPKRNTWSDERDGSESVSAPDEETR